MERPPGEEFEDLSAVVKIRARREWGALPPKSKERLKPPVRFIHVSLTGHEHCYDRKSCKDTLLQIQKEAMDKGHPDIPYNFLISGHGKIYEGRGWKVKVRRPDIPFYRDNQLSIGFIGDRIYGTPDEEKGLMSFKELVQYAVEHGMLTLNYRLDDEKGITVY